MVRDESVIVENSEVNNIKVSVVMPVLNVAPYLRECLDSVAGQSLREIEILCVDGGSTDGSLEILREYAGRDSRITVLNEEKGSSGFANNLGIDSARGQYIGIVETDDYVSEDMFEKLYEAAVKYEADIVKADYQGFFGDGDDRFFLYKSIAGSPGDYERVIVPEREQRVFQYDCSTWAGIYRRAFLKENGIRHNETPGAAYQDNGFWFQTYAFAKSLVYISLPLYRYRMDNPNSSVHNRKKLYAICEEYDFIRRRLREAGIYEGFNRIYIHMKFIRYVSSYYRLSEGLKTEFSSRFHQEMAEHQRAGEIYRRDFTEEQQQLLDRILDSPASFEDYVAANQSAFCELLDNKKSFIVFGCGSDGIRLLCRLGEQKRLEKVVCLCDNNKNLHGSRAFGREILSPEKAYEKYRGADFLISSLNYAAEMVRQLENLGIERKKIKVLNVC